MQCSEQFYRECVKSELEGKMCDERGAKDVPEDVRSHVRFLQANLTCLVLQSADTCDEDKPFYLNCPIDFSRRTPNASASDANDECDEEDHSKDYIHLVETLTRESAEKMRNVESLCEKDDEEIGAPKCFEMIVNEKALLVDRQLLARGIAGDIEELLSQLTTDEHANFDALCDEFDVHQTRQMGQSSFRQRDRK